MNKKRKLLVTSALPYANGSIHLGHLVEYIQTDIWVRFHKLIGNTCLYMCADDAHGTPIMVSAKNQGISPEALIEKFHVEHARDFNEFHIEFDNYYTTNSPENKALSEYIYEQARKKGVIYEKEIEQYFCPGCDMFLPDRFIRGACPHCGALDQYGDSCEKCSATYTPTSLINPVCAQCGRTPELRKSNHFFFKLSAFEKDLEKWVSSGPLRSEIQNKLKEWFKVGIKDWDISRDAPYFGFKIPGTEDKYFYVWLDAPVGYMAATEEWCKRNGANFEELWKGDEFEIHHFIGKDILYFHSLFWPAMLMVSGFSLPKQIRVHGFLTVNGEKMSKSRGTFIKARTYLDHFNPEFLRYYYAAKLSTGIEDIDFKVDDFVFKVNSDVLGKVINIGSRLGSIVTKKLEGKLSRPDEKGNAIVQQIRDKAQDVAQAYEQLEFHKAMRDIMALADHVNKYINDEAPWAVVKTDQEKARSVCTAGLEGGFLKILAFL